MTLRRHLLALIVVFGLLIAVAAPANAWLAYYANCSHYAYRLTTYADESTSTANARPLSVHNGSGNTQLVEVYSYGVKLAGGIWLVPNSTYYFPNSGAQFPWNRADSWKVQYSDGHNCFFPNR